MKRYSPVLCTAALCLTTAAVATPARAQSVSSEALLKARSNCLVSVAKVVGLPSTRLKVIRQVSDASGINTDVKVPNATAPWGCLTDRKGTVEHVHFKGSEGAL